VGLGVTRHLSLVPGLVAAVNSSEVLRAVAPGIQRSKPALVTSWPSTP